MKRILPRVPPIFVFKMAIFVVFNCFILYFFLVSLPSRSEDSDTLTSPLKALSARTLDIPPFIAQPLEAYRETLSRPVFTSTRRASEIIAASANTPPSPTLNQQQGDAPPPIQLSGVSIIGEARKGYFVSPGENEGTWLTEGDQYLGWTVISITPIGARMRQNQTEIHIKLYVDNR